MYKVSGEILKNETLIEFELFDQFGWTADDGGGSNLQRMQQNRMNKKTQFL